MTLLNVAMWLLQCNVFLRKFFWGKKTTKTVTIVILLIFLRIHTVFVSPQPAHARRRYYFFSAIIVSINLIEFLLLALFDRRNTVFHGNFVVSARFSMEILF